MNITRIALLYQIVSSAFVGIWALFFPDAFYTNFPGFGMHWIRADGAFNEHLIRDVGSLNLGLAIATTYALTSKNPAAAIASALVGVVFSVPHFLYHFQHLELLPNLFERVLNMVLLGGHVIAPVLMLKTRGES